MSIIWRFNIICNDVAACSAVAKSNFNMTAISAVSAVAFVINYNAARRQWRELIAFYFDFFKIRVCSENVLTVVAISLYVGT